MNFSDLTPIAPQMSTYDARVAANPRVLGELQHGTIYIILRASEDKQRRFSQRETGRLGSLNFSKGFISLTFSKGFFQC